jgi:UDP-N-acetylglucosamine---dolichyl-phosphate N-acetylglucosaminyltransferase
MQLTKHITGIKNIMKYRVIIPVYNESKYIEKLIAKIPEKHLSSVIFVNDGSTDNTLKELENFTKTGINIISHKVNIGKGKALETGCLKAIKDNAELIIFMDGDLQHDPKDLDRFIRAFKKDKKLEIAFGARNMGENMKFAVFTANKLLTISTNLLHRYFLNDTQCGFRAFRSRVFKKLKWNSSKYEVETEIIINSAKNQLKYKEIPIDSIYLERYKGTGIMDGVKIMSKILAWKIFK